MGPRSSRITAGALSEMPMKRLSTWPATCVRRSRKRASEAPWHGHAGGHRGGREEPGAAAQSRMHGQQHPLLGLPEASGADTEPALSGMSRGCVAPAEHHRAPVPEPRAVALTLTVLTVS